MRENKPVLLVLFPLHHKPLSRRAYRGFKPGDEVFGSYISDPQDSGVAVWIHCYGAFAEYACAPESRLVMKPGNVTFEQAASVPLAAFTALQGLRDKGHIQPGQKVLINGAAGGVGTFAVQIARWFGADVTGVCSTRKALSSSQAQLDSEEIYTLPPSLYVVVQ